MPISSMTGFARTAGDGIWNWAWEIKTVNAKGLDIRLRLPPAFEALGEQARGRIGKAVTRGTCFVTLTARREAAAPVIRLNTALLDSLMAALQPYEARAGGLSIGALLGLRGVIDIIEGEDDAPPACVQAEMLAGLEAALAGLGEAREREGRALAALLADRLAAMSRLAAAADAAPARKPAAIRARLAEQIAMVLDSGQGFDANRLHQEAVLLAAKADIREEIDRLNTHVEAARALLAAGGPVGRRLDFLAQEFSREANTLCAKANDVSLTAIGLDLRTEIEQFREQVQNVE